MSGNLLDTRYFQLDAHVNIDQLAFLEQVGNGVAVAVQKFDGGGKFPGGYRHGLLLEELLYAFDEFLEEEGARHFVEAGGHGFAVLSVEFFIVVLFVDVAEVSVEVVSHGISHVLLEEVRFEASEHVDLALLAVARLQVGNALSFHIYYVAAVLCCNHSFRGYQ